MKKQTVGGWLLVVLAAVLMLGLTGCELFPNLFGGPGDINDPVPLEAFLIYGGGQWVTLRAHPSLEDGGVKVTVQVSEACHVDWDDESELGQTGGAGNSISHTYTRQGTYIIRCWTDVVDRDWKEVELTVVVENQNPIIGPSCVDDPQLGWRQNMTVLMNPRVQGCDSATGAFMYQYGVVDPDGDDTRARINIWLVQEFTVDGERVRWDTVEPWTVFSVHDRSVITNQWVDVWGFWFQVGYIGSIPPWPFATWDHAALEPAGFYEYTAGPLGVQPKGWPVPDWPDCGDCDDPVDPPPADPPDEEEPEEVAGDCYVKMMWEVIDPWGGYRHQVWFIPLNGCAYQCGGTPCPPVVQPPGGGCG